MSVIIDTGCANINSLKFALERLGESVQVSADPVVIKSGDHVFLPGVGSAGFAMDAIQKRGLDVVVQSLSQPVLGICLGMQLLLSSSSEGNVQCLGVIKGEIDKLDAGAGRLPHMGWNTLHGMQQHLLLTGITTSEYFYFVHSFAAGLTGSTIAQCQYGSDFTAVVAHQNFMGVQFHPERSGSAGSRVLSNFLEIRA